MAKQSGVGVNVVDQHRSREDETEDFVSLGKECGKQEWGKQECRNQEWNRNNHVT